MKNSCTLLTLWLMISFCSSCHHHATEHTRGQLPDTFPLVRRHLSLLFVGDVMVHGPQITAAKRGADHFSFDQTFELVRPIIDSVDLAFANLETTLSGHPYRGYPRFSSPDQLADALANAGFDVVTTANNHCNDRGSKGISRTIEQLQQRGLKTTGTYSDHRDSISRTPLILEKNGLRIGIMAYTYGTNGLKVKDPARVDLIDTLSMQRKIRTMIDSCKVDYAIAIMHWGLEYQKRPSPWQRELAKWLHRQGINAIIGSHPHVIQGIERFDSGDGPSTFCLYSLGNFISNQTSPSGTRGGLMLRLDLELDPLSRRITTTANSHFVWMQKVDRMGKVVYRLIPTFLDDPKMSEVLSDEEYQTFRYFSHYYRSTPLPRVYQ